MLPLLDLNDALGFAGEDRRCGDEPINIVVLHADRGRFGLIVDRIDDAQEIVVRPLARRLKGIACLAGATIMGDGKIALILDAFGLARGLEPPREAGEGAVELGRDADGLTSAPESLVLLRGTRDGPMAIAMADVERLETFPNSSIEWVADHPLVAYRKALMPLVDVESWLRGESRPARRATR